MAIAVGGGGFVRLAAGVLQSEERFIASTLVSESANYLLLAAALIALATGLTTALLPFALVAIAQLVLAGAVWVPLMAEQKVAQHPATPMRLSEMLLLTGTSAATLVQIQVERFAIPMFLNLEDLAAFAVLAVFTIAPFRPIEFSTYRMLFPKLRRPGSALERRRLFLKEVVQTSLLLLGIGLAIALVTPLVLGFLFGGKYHFSIERCLGGHRGWPVARGAQSRLGRDLRPRRPAGPRHLDRRRLGFRGCCICRRLGRVGVGVRWLPLGRGSGLGRQHRPHRAGGRTPPAIAWLLSRAAVGPLSRGSGSARIIAASFVHGVPGKCLSTPMPATITASSRPGAR